MTKKEAVKVLKESKKIEFTTPVDRFVSGRFSISFVPDESADGLGMVGDDDLSPLYQAALINHLLEGLFLFVADIPKKERKLLAKQLKQAQKFVKEWKYYKVQ